MSEVIGRQLDYVCLIYLLGSGILAAVCLRLRPDERTRSAWGWVGTFAALQSLGGLLSLVSSSLFDSQFLVGLRVGLDLLSGLALAESARRSSRSALGRASGPCIVVALLAIAATRSIVHPDPYVKASLCLLVTVGGLCGAAVLIRLRSADGQPHRRLLLSMTMLLALYPVLLGFSIYDAGVHSIYDALRDGSLPVMWVTLRLAQGGLCLAASMILCCCRGLMDGKSAEEARRCPLSWALIGVTLLIFSGWCATEQLGDMYMRGVRIQLSHQTHIASLIFSPDDLADIRSHQPRASTGVASTLRVVLDHIPGGRYAYLIEADGGRARILVGTDSDQMVRPDSEGLWNVIRVPVALRDGATVVTEPIARNGQLWIAVSTPIIGRNSTQPAATLSILVDAHHTVSVHAQLRLVAIVLSNIRSRLRVTGIGERPSSEVQNDGRLSFVSRGTIRA